MGSSLPELNLKRDHQDEIQEDILMEIFSRLPVKTLFQLQSVCRRWNTIINY
ncbi:unnamed protein product, partial [Linum tenue]